MTSSYNAIVNLLNLYGERMDAGDFAGCAALFEHAEVEKNAGRPLTGRDLLDYWSRVVILYPDGTPRTKHVFTNPIIEIDEEAGTATCRASYMVLQGLPDFPLQIIVAGRYHDRFERVDGAWRFSFRDYSLRDFAGDLSRHIRPAVKEAFLAATREAAG